jgi:hypothetical protein
MKRAIVFTLDASPSGIFKQMPWPTTQPQGYIMQVTQQPKPRHQPASHTPLIALRSHNMLKHQATQPAATPQPHTAGAVACYKGSGVAAGVAGRSTGRACASHGTDVMAPFGPLF